MTIINDYSKIDSRRLTCDDKLVKKHVTIILGFIKKVFIILPSLFFVRDEVLILCTHIKKLHFINKKSLKYNLKLIYLIIKNSKNTIDYTIFYKVKII